MTFAKFAEVQPRVTKMRQIEEANKFELVLSMKARVAPRVLAGEVIEGGDVLYWPKTDIDQVWSTDPNL